MERGTHLCCRLKWGGGGEKDARRERAVGRGGRAGRRRVKIGSTGLDFGAAFAVVLRLLAPLQRAGRRVQTEEKECRVREKRSVSILSRETTSVENHVVPRLKIRKWIPLPSSCPDCIAKNSKKRIGESHLDCFFITS